MAYHILNGDSLKKQFPEEIKGEIIIARECLVDGDVKGDNWDEFFGVRSRFISKSYGNYTSQDYYRDTVSEFEKVRNIPENSSINLWFEDDLFCQVNFWFVINLINKTIPKNPLFLIRPKSHTPYGFGGLNKQELISIYKNKQELTDIDELAKLWEFYKQNAIEKLVETSNRLKASYPFISKAVEAHIERIPANGKLGRPTESLISIMKDLQTEDFGEIFREFSKRESIYGYGDLQVRRLYDEIIN